MELSQIFVSSCGAYLLGYDKSSDRWVGAFCWSGEQIFRTMQAWNISMGQVLGIARQMHDPNNAILPKTHARQAVTIEGLIAKCLGAQFGKIETLISIGEGKTIATFPSVPSKQIFAWIAAPAAKGFQAMIIFFIEPNGTPNLVIVRDQMQGLTVLSYEWMEDQQKSMCQHALGNLPIIGDDLDVPTLIQGDIVRLLIIGQALYDLRFPSETPQTS